MARKLAWVCLLLQVAPSWAAGTSVRAYYHDHVAARETGVYETADMVYFHTRLAADRKVDDNKWRMQSMLSTQRLMRDWVEKHAPPYESLPAWLRTLDRLNGAFGNGGSSFSVNVTGRGFHAEDGNGVSYGFAVPMSDMLKEASRGRPGKTETDIVAAWRKTCARTLAGKRAEELLTAIHCWPLASVREDLGDRCRTEIMFLRGLDPKATLGNMLLDTRPIAVPAEEPWVTGLELLGDLNGRQVQLKDSELRLREALIETPGSMALWRCMARLLVERKLYALAAVSYKNAFCLASAKERPRLVIGVSSDLALIWHALKDDAAAEGFELLSMVQ